jgi:hypothetical protein
LRLALSVATRSVVGGRVSTSRRWVSARDFLLDRLQEALPALILVVLWL